LRTKISIAISLALALNSVITPFNYADLEANLKAHEAFSLTSVELLITYLGVNSYIYAMEKNHENL
jgi:hypothetical protein